jgi:hypothetical protein
MSTRKPIRVRQASPDVAVPEDHPDKQINPEPCSGAREKNAQDPPASPPEPLPVALRAYTETPEPDADISEQHHRKRGKRRRRAQREDRYVLVLDTETTIDHAQRLTFGVARYYRTRRAGGKLVCVDEIIFHDDELPQRDPDRYELLRRYAKYREPAIDWKAGDDLTSDAPVQIRLLTASEMRELIYVAAYKNRALVVCFNLPFDLSRVAIEWAETRGGKTRAQRQASSFEGGFTLRYFLHDGKPNRYRPELRIKTIDSKRALKQFSAPHEIEDAERDADGLPFRGHLLDLRTIAFALTDRGHTLESACAAFGVTHRDVLGAAGCRRRSIPKAEWGKPYRKQETEHGKITRKYIDYCRDDVAATARLYEAISAEYRRHSIKLQITKMYSPASGGKGYLRAMGVRPRLELQPDFPRDVLGHAMTAYFGGRAECRIRRVSVPVIYLDFLSMYPTVNALMALWRHVTATRIEVEDNTERVRTLVERVGVEDCLDPALWRELPGLVQVRPRGEVLPVRARYGSDRSWGIGSNPLHSDEPLWYALPDVIACKLITGQAPEIIRALALKPVDRQRGLKPVKLRGEIEVDPRTDDLFRTAIEQRHQLDDKNGPLGRFLKTFANGTSYGIYAEMIRRELASGQRQEVTVYGAAEEAFTAAVTAPEQPGADAFPPMAATITAAARLMLATLEALVTQAGGVWAFCDTDSMAIVAAEDSTLIHCPGGLVEQDLHDRESVRALTWEQVDEIVARFEALNPYDPAIVSGSVLKIEDQNYELDPADPERTRVLKDERRQLYCHAISAKRYQLYNLDEHGRPTLRRIGDGQDGEDTDPADAETPDALDELRKHSEHGLGHLLNPTDPKSESRDWIAQLSDYVVRTDALGLDASEPGWLDRPALTRVTITSPRLLKPFDAYNRRRPVADRIRPYNFGLVAHVNKPGLHGLPERFLAVAPFEKDPGKWRRLPWSNAYEPGSRYEIVPDDRTGEQLATAINGRVIVKTYRTVLDDYRTHPEAKSLGPDGRPCDRRTVGLLTRRPVRVAAIHYIGKEANKLDERESGLVADLDDVLTEYRNPEQDSFRRLVVPVLRELPVDRIAAAAGVSERTVKRARAGQPIGRNVRSKLTAYAIQHARVELRSAGIRPPTDHEALFAACLDRRRPAAPEPQLCACGCGRPIRRGQRGPASKWHSDTCRKRVARSAGSSMAPWANLCQARLESQG